MAKSSGSIVSALLQRQRAEERYLANPNFCKHCLSMITIDPKRKVSEIRQKKFCNRTCSASFNNAKFPKKRKRNKNISRRCRVCGAPVPKRKFTCSEECKKVRGLKKTRTGKLSGWTKGELFGRRGGYQSARSSIQRHARQTYLDGGKEKKCCVCGYSNHVDVAHIRSVSSFSTDTLIREINDIDNLLPLCPNHHWEYDAGIFKF